VATEEKTHPETHKKNIQEKSSKTNKRRTK
jgi:hypothetical protein